MPIIQSFGALQARTSTTASPPYWPTSGGVSLYGGNLAYAEIYKRQPNVRTCVDFLARNIAQLGLHVFRRVSGTDRERLTDHDLARWLTRPNPSTTRYRLMQSLMGDLGIYFDAYWLKVRSGNGDLGLVRLPPDQMSVEGGLLPSRYWWTYLGKRTELAAADVVHFNGYNPLNPLMGLSPLDTLHQILAEEAAAADHREAYWRNAGRMDSVIETTKDSPNWNATQQQDLRRQLQEFSAGGAKAGMTMVLPKGLVLKPASFSMRDAEYLSARKLSREECAAAYHIPLPMVGILDHATFSNIKEQHKQLYQDSLGPWLEMIQEEIEAQLLPDARDQADVYVEFNIADKLKGSFEEQAAALHALVGRPIMTANEGRARLNLPAMDDPSADELAPQQGGPAAFGGTPPTALPEADPEDTDEVPAAEEQARTVATIIAATRARQTVRLARIHPAQRAERFHTHAQDRWNRELATDLIAAGLADADAWRLAHQTNGETYFRLQAEALSGAPR